MVSKNLQITFFLETDTNAINLKSNTYRPNKFHSKNSKSVSNILNLNTLHKSNLMKVQLFDSNIKQSDTQSK